MIGFMIFSLAMSTLLVPVSAGCSFNGYQLLKAVPHTEEQLAFLKEIQGIQGPVASRLDPRGFTKYMNSWLSASVVGVPSLIWGKRGSVNVLRRTLEQKGLTATVIVENGNNFLDQTPSSEFHPQQFFPGMKVAEFDLERYHRLEEIELLMTALKEELPDSVELLTIGQSFEGRNITVVKVSTKEAGERQKKGFWLEFGIHAREWISHATGVHFLVYLLTSDSVRATELRNNVDWYLVLVSNPDGYVYSWDHDRFWRKTRSIAPECVDVCQANRSITDDELEACDGCCRGADPNRNWDVNWGAKSGSNSMPDCTHACCDTYAGRHAFSEPEVKAMALFLVQNQHRINLFLSVHSYSQMWLIPYAYSRHVKPEEFDVLQYLSHLVVGTMKNVHGETYEFGQASKLMYQAFGTNMDWVRNSTAIDFAFGLELRGDRDRTMALPAFCLPDKEIIPQAKEFWAGVEVLYDQIVVNNLTRSSTLLSSAVPPHISLLCTAIIALFHCF